MSVALAFHRGLHKRPGGWTPAQLGTLSLWLDADDATTITVATGVSQWNDKSGNGRNVTQDTGANQPQYTVRSQNGRASLGFNGSSQFLVGTDTLDLGTGSLSAAVAFKTANTNVLFIVSKRRIDASIAGSWDVTANRVVLRQDFNREGSSTATVNAFAVGSYRIDRTAGVTAWFNGTAGTTTTTGFPDTTNYNTEPKLFVGACQSGIGSAGANFFNGEVGEIVLSLSSWTTDERQQVEGYLAHKWGTTASLPSGHPYKSVAP